jgi:polysaccharide export outer membrane protein
VLRALAALVALTVAACTAPPVYDKRDDVAAEVLRSSVRLQKEYLLFAGDQVEVAVWRTPEASRTVMVRPDGFISLPLIQEIQAAGLTPRELADNVRRALSARLVDPEVTVIPVNMRQPTVYVLGDVRTPGAFPLRNAVTAAQAIAMAGGGLRSATADDATLIRLSPEGYLEAMPLQAVAPANLSGTLLTLASTPLKPDDIVFIPESGRSQVMRVLSDLLVPLQIYLNYRILENTQ